MLPTTIDLISLVEQTAAYAWSAEPAPYLEDAEAQRLDGGQDLDQALRWANDEGCWIYPAFQFSLGRVDPGVVRVTQAFVQIFQERRTNAPLAVLAAWLCAEQETWDGASALELLRLGRHEDVVHRVTAWTRGLFDEPTGTPALHQA